MALLDDVKLLLDISEDETDLDDKLSLIIDNASALLLSYLTAGIEEVPEALEYIVCELSIARFNRIGNEAMSSYSQEGESITYNSDDISPYLSAIDAWNAAQDGNTKGVVRFI